MGRLGGGRGSAGGGRGRPGTPGARRGGAGGGRGTRRGEAANQGARGRLGVAFAPNPSAKVPPDLVVEVLKVAILLGLYEKTQRPAIFRLLAAPRYFRKSAIFDGRVVKNGTTLLSGAVLGNHPPAKVCIFDGRVVKNRGSRNSSGLPAMPALLAEMGRPPQLGAAR